MAEKNAHKYGERYPDWGWCPQCQTEVPLLSSESAGKAANDVTNIIKGHRAHSGESLEQALLSTRAIRASCVRPMWRGEEVSADQLVKYADHMLKHTPENFGPPCPTCGKLIGRHATKCNECT